VEFWPYEVLLGWETGLKNLFLVSSPSNIIDDWSLVCSPTALGLAFRDIPFELFENKFERNSGYFGAVSTVTWSWPIQRGFLPICLTPGVTSLPVRGESDGLVSALVFIMIVPERLYLFGGSSCS